MKHRTVALSMETVKWLESLKLIKSESYDNVLRRIKRKEVIL